MVRYITDFCIMGWKLYLAWGVIKIILFTMGSGKIMLKTDGVFIKTKRLDIVMQGNGNKIEEMDMGVKVL